MKNISIQILKDGPRTVVIIEGDDVHKRDDLAYYIAQAYQMPDDMAERARKQYKPTDNQKCESVQVETVDGLEPVPYVKPKVTQDQIKQMDPYAPEIVTISGGEYEGQTPSAAVKTDGIRAVALLFDYLRKQHGKIPNVEEKEIISVCKAYMRASPEHVQQLKNKAQQGTWLQYASRLMDIEPVLHDITGYKHLEVVLSRCTDEIITQIIAKLAEMMRQRGMK